MNRSTVLVRHTRTNQKAELQRSAKFFVNGVEVYGVITYMVDDAVGTPAQRMTLEFYADVTIEQEDDAVESAHHL